MAFDIKNNITVDSKIIEFLDNAVEENLLTEETASIMLTIAKTLIVTDKMCDGSILNKPRVLPISDVGVSVCVNCDQEKETHAICSDCLTKIIDENKQTEC